MEHLIEQTWQGASKRYPHPRGIPDKVCRQIVHEFELIEPSWQPKVEGRSVKLRVWDFGGQHILHGTHEMFLTGRAVCVIVLDATREVDDEGNRLTYWLKMKHQ